MNRTEIATENHKKGCNCAQSVLCAFCDRTDFTEDELFRMSEAFGSGMGLRKVCGAASAMTLLVGILKSRGVDALPESNKKESYEMSGMLLQEFEEKVGTLLCGEIKKGARVSCDECIETAVRILEEKLG